MARAHAPLLAELHAHTTWSDGEFRIPELVELYGHAGFDILAVTDHVVTSAEGVHVRAENFGAYLAELDTEAERAAHQFGLVLIPGLELTVEHEDPRQAGHAVAVGLREFVGIDDGLDEALRRAREAGAALIGAHPYTIERAVSATRFTARFSEEPDWAAEVLDRFELLNRDDVFGWVAERKLPAVASGDFHRREHLETWKTVVSCAKEELAVVEELRSGRPCALTRVEPARRVTRRVA
jgi:predicted metal-dependent phosphoesterase TrpH